MAITRTQIAKQLLEKGGRVGLRGGADAATKSFDRSANPGRRDGPIGRDDPPGGFDLGGGQGPTFDGAPASQLSSQAAERARKFIASQKDDRSRIAKTFNLLNPFSKERQKLAYKLSMGFPGQEKRSAKYQKAYKDYLESLGITEEDLEGELPSSDFFVNKAFKENLKPVDAMLDPPMSYGEFLLKEFNNPTVLYRGDIGRYRQEMGLDDDDPPLLFPRSGIMAQAPEEKKEEDEDPVNLRLLAEGGRAGFQEGGGIEQRLEKLGGDVSSAEKMLQGINKRLETAESSLSSGGRGPGGLGTLATLAGSNQPFMGNMLPSNADPQKEKLTPLGNNFPGLGIFPPTADQLQVGEMGQIPEQFREGYAEYMKGKPIPMGGQAISYVTLPGGGTVAFGDTGSAGSFREYLKSTGFTPPMSPLLRPVQLPDLQPGITQDLATQVVQSPQQDPNIFGYDPSGSASIQDRYSTAQQAAEKARKEGFAGRIKLPGEMSFEDFSDLYNRGGLTPLRAAGSDELGFANLESLGNFGKLNFIPMRGGAEMMEAAGIPMGRSSGIPAAGFADGGDVVGGEYDFESARQAYGLGKLVKKITRSVKKIAKSPLGKAAILGAVSFGIPGTSFGGLFSKGSASNLFSKAFLKKGATDFTLANISPIKTIGLASILGGFATKQDEDEEQQYAGADFPNPIDFYLSGQAPMNTRLAAEGGLMRAGYQEGSKEPVAKKTMPLLDMGGMEKDYREEGGFVPIGRMEKADDVPARLSKNEFVFTADAVRNAGDGDVDLGAEKMYNMMKNLEAGGDVSEESQGLKGAREMFQTSQRLEEVL